ncbi:DUF6518 family protein [Actinoplanes sp. NPDC049118]|uniref:DUF6518 family protein n=1 Tax=Actinoplanes sp. NPDC049118 TaxID=3155769 RepID=UPI0033CEC9B6
MTDRIRFWLPAAAGGGVLLGVVDLLLQLSLPYPLANLANSSAVWAVAAFAAGRTLRAGPLRAALAGVVLLVVAVQAYYVAAIVLLHDDPQTLWAPSTLIWMTFGVLAGAVFGAAGHLSRDHAGRWVAVAAAMPGAVLLAEALSLWRAPRADAAATAVVEAVLGIVLVLWAARGPAVRVQALAASLVLAPLGLGLFLAAGFGG